MNPIRIETLCPYPLSSKLGHGSYGIAFSSSLKTFTLSDQKVTKSKTYDVVVKIVERGNHVEDCFRRLIGLNHPNISKVLDLFWVNNTLHLVTPYHGISLDKIGNTLSNDNINSIIKQVTSGLAYIHSLNYVHGDIKPPNICYMNGIATIIDYDYLDTLDHFRDLAKKNNYDVVTIWYRAPEILLHSAFDCRIDVWSLGCVWYELLCQQHLFTPALPFEAIQKISDVLGSPTGPHLLTNYNNLGLYSKIGTANHYIRKNDIFTRIFCYENRISASELLKLFP